MILLRFYSRVLASCVNVERISLIGVGAARKEEKGRNGTNGRKMFSKLQVMLKLKSNSSCGVKSLTTPMQLVLV